MDTTVILENGCANTEYPGQSC